MSKGPKTSSRKVSKRTCVACGTSEDKHDLIRFVRSKDGVVNFDAKGCASGRGAYLCASDECFSAAEKRGRLGVALKCQLMSADYQRLKEELRGFSPKQEQRT